MQFRKGVGGNRGFALLIVFILMSAVTIGLVMLTSTAFKGDKSSKNEVTVTRINAVSKALSQYYLGHRSLPDPGPNLRVPVSQLTLQVEYGLDGWGKFLHYNYVSNLRGIGVDGKPMAAVLISGGPNQAMEAVTRPGNGTIYVDAGNDDIVMPVTLQSEAVALATTTLHSLAGKTCSYIHVNGEVALDADDFDATDGIGILDNFLYEFSLNTGSYTLDPWGNSYHWLGESSSPTNSFRSLGPDGVISGDDIIVPAHTTFTECS